MQWSLSENSKKRHRENEDGSIKAAGNILK